MALCVARRHPQLRVVGIDSDREALALARRRAEAEGLTNVAFVVEDATRLHLQVVGGGEAGELKPLLDETDLLIALHACGGLADAALSLASKLRASAIVCACCYGKQGGLCPPDAAWGVRDEERRMLCAMADASEEPDTAAASRRAIGRLRVDSAGRRRPAALLRVTDDSRLPGVMIRVEDAGPGGP